MKGVSCPTNTSTYQNEMLYISINRDTYQRANFHIFNEKTFWYYYVRKSQRWLTLLAFCLGVFLVAPGLFFLDGSLLHINPTQPSVSWTEIWGKHRVPLEVSAWTFLLLLLINYLPEVWLGIPCWNTTQCCVFSFFFFFLLHSALSLPSFPRLCIQRAYLAWRWAPGDWATPI